MAGRAEEDAGAVGDADVRVAGGLALGVGLRLDDSPADPCDEQRAADQITGDGDRIAIEERPGDPPRRSAPAAQLPSAVSAAEACSSWAATDSDDVPPAERFDSSQLLLARTS